MKNERTFFKCGKCGNIITYVNNAGPAVICCGEKLQELKPNTSDGAHEKHVPAAAREGNKLKVTVGSVAHPMTAEHHIAWIAAAEEGKTQRVALQPTSVPSAELVVGNGAVTVYAYCNLHGLWAVEA